jgi:hypothetical protein
MVRIWPMAEYRQLFAFEAHWTAVTCMACDENFIINGVEDGVKLWDLKTGRLLQHFAAT